LHKEVAINFGSHRVLDPDIEFFEGILYHCRIGEIYRILLITQEVIEKNSYEFLRAGMYPGTFEVIFDIA